MTTMHLVYTPGQQVGKLSGVQKGRESLPSRLRIWIPPPVPPVALSDFGQAKQSHCELELQTNIVKERWDNKQTKPWK